MNSPLTSLFYFFFGSFTLGLYGCESGCDSAAHAAVALEIVNDLNQPAEEASLVYTDARGIERRNSCSSDDPSDTCDQVELGSTPGTYNIQITAEGYQPVTISVDVPGNECDQPELQHITVRLEPL